MTLTGRESGLKSQRILIATELEFNTGQRYAKFLQQNL